MVDSTDHDVAILITVIGIRNPITDVRKVVIHDFRKKKGIQCFLERVNSGLLSLLTEKLSGDQDEIPKTVVLLVSLSVKITFATLSVLHGVVKHAIFAGVYR